MKKVSFAVASMLSVSALALTPVVASADPIGINVAITCPAAKGGGEFVITNHGGGVVAGKGIEDIKGVGFHEILFKTTIARPEIPREFTNYDNSSVQYDSTTGVVTCNFKSTFGEPDISVDYALTNGKGGSVIMQSNNTIQFILPFGLK